MKRLLNVMTIAFLFILSMTIGTKADENQNNIMQKTTGLCGMGVTWSYENHTLIISGSGGMYNYYEKQGKITPWYGYANDIYKIDVQEGVTSLGAYSFVNLTQLTEISLPNTLFSIHECAFLNCDKLCTIIIPDSVEEIGDYAIGFHSNLGPDMTCQKNNKLIIHCSKNTEGYVYATDEEFKYTTHDFSIQMINPTCTKTGKMIYTCNTCHYSCEEIIEEKGHSYDIGKIEIPSTIFSQGTVSFQCDECGEKLVKPLPQSMVKKGLVFTYKDVVYQIISVNKKKRALRVMSYDGKKSKIIIPAFVTIQNKKFPVTQIAADSFAQKDIKEVRIGKNVTKIYDRAFLQCNNLKKVTFTGNRLTHFGKQVFDGVSPKIKYKFPKNRKKYYKKQMKR